MIHYGAMKTLARTLKRPGVIPALVAAILTGLLYGDALHLPLFSDDLIQVPWLRAITWGELWRTPSPYGYYRPLWYSLWRVWGALSGGLRPFSLHLLNLVTHVAAAGLLGLLAQTWLRPPSSRGAGPWIAGVTAALFAAFPFSRQAVAWPGAVYNPLVSAMVAGAVLAYDRGRRGQGAGWLLLALALSGMAPFTYEVGLLAGPMLLLAEGIGRWTGRWERPAGGWPLLVAALSGGTFLVWRAMRGSGVVGFGLSAADVRQNVGYLLQGLTYPTAPLAQSLATRSPLGAEPALWLVALPTAALLLWIGWHAAPQVVLLGGAWFALFAVPPLISMEAEWFALAPRYLYMTAGGAGLIWGAAFDAARRWAGAWPLKWPGARPLRRAFLGLALVACLAPGVLFVRRGMHLYRLAGAVIWDVVETSGREEPPLLLVNLPTSLIPARRIFPLGFEGVTPLPKRVPAERIVHAHTGRENATEARSFAILDTSTPAGYDVHPYGQPMGWEEILEFLRRGYAVYLARYEGQDVVLEEAGRMRRGMTPPPTPLTRFGEDVLLLDLQALCDEAGRVELRAYWAVTEDLGTDVTVFAHLLGEDGGLVTQADGYPVGGMAPLWLWQPGELVRDVRAFDAVPPGTYTVRLGMWELATGARWEAAGHPEGMLHLPVHCP